MLSIVVSWRDRPEIGEVVPHLVAEARAAGGEVVIVNLSGDSDSLRMRLGSWRQQLCVVEVVGERYFNKSLAQNLGAAHSAAPILFFCDCDIILEPSSVSDLAREIHANKGFFATLAGVKESQRNSRGGRHVVSFGYTLRVLTADGRRLEIVDNEEDAREGTRQAPGLLLVRRSDFLAVDGYNGNLHGWGWEDQDMVARLTLGRGLERITRGTALHLSHDDRARVAHYPNSDRWENRDRMFRQALSNYDDANFQGTYARDIVACAGRVTSNVTSRLVPS